MIIATPTKIQALRERFRVRAALRGQPVCTACDSDRKHTDAQCIARRPTCRLCNRPTCIQARWNGCGPLCLDHFFSQTWPRLLPDVGIFVRRVNDRPLGVRDGVLGIVASVGPMLGALVVEVRIGPMTSAMVPPDVFWDRWERSEEIPAFLIRRAA